MTNYTQKIGTLTDRAFYTTHAIMEAMEIESIRHSFIRHCSTDIWMRNAYLAYAVLQEFEAVLDNNSVFDKIVGELWIDPADFTYEERKELLLNSAFAEYLDYDEDFKDLVATYHPEVIRIISDAITEKVEVYEMGGHSDFFYPEREYNGAFTVNVEEFMASLTFWDVAHNGTKQELYDYVVKKTVAYIKSFNFSSGFTIPENLHSNFVWEWDFINRISTEILAGLDVVDNEMLRITINKWYNI